jgi:chromate reductase, NAD(P)H dehydrogenase (quinone)
VKTVLAIPGSLRKASHNRALLRTAKELAPPETSIVVYEELSSIPLFDEDVEARTNGGPEPVRRLREQVDAADGLLISTPEYNHSIPGVLKNAIDWLSRPAPREVLVGKPVAVMGASGGPWGTRLAQAAVRQVLYATECIVLPSPALYLRNAGTLFDEADNLTDAATRERLATFMAAFDAWMVRVASSDPSQITAVRK